MWNFAFKHPYLFALVVVPTAAEGIADVGERLHNYVRTKMGAKTTTPATPTATTTTSAGADDATTLG